MRPRKGGRTGFGQIFHDGGWGFHCFACPKSTSLYQLSIDLGMGSDDIGGGYTSRKRINYIPKPRLWFDKVDTLQSDYVSSANVYDSWQDYKKISSNIVDKYGLGLGSLPETRCKHNRLITPIRDRSGDVKWFRGRSIDCDCEKWIGASGISPYEVPLPLSYWLKPDTTIFIVENFVDAIIINETTPYQAVSSLSVSYWCDRWTRAIKAVNAPYVMVTFDADMPGNGATCETHLVTAAKARIYRKLLIEGVELSTDDIEVVEIGYNNTQILIDWIAFGGIEAGQMAMPQPSGVKLANRLRKEGINAYVSKWNEGEEGMDIGSLYLNHIEKNGMME